MVLAPQTDNVAVGEEVPIPRKLFVLSQKNLELAAKAPEPLLNWTWPMVPAELMPQAVEMILPVESVARQAALLTLSVVM